MKSTILLTPEKAIAYLQEQIRRRELTQAELAQRLDMSDRHVRRLLRGEAPLSTVARAFEVLGIQARQLLEVEVEA